MSVLVHVSMHSTHSPYCAEPGEHVSANGCVKSRTDIESVCAGKCDCVCVFVCVYREKARPHAALGAQSPFPVVQCDKFPCQILPAPPYF